MKLYDIAKLCNTTCPRDIDIVGLNTLDDASANELSFFDNEKYLNSLKSTKAGAVLLSSSFSSYVPQNTISIITDEPYLCLARLSKYFKKELISVSYKDPIIGENTTLENHVNLGSSVVIGKNVLIGAGVCIGDNVSIGDDCIIHPNVVVYNDTKIGKSSTIHAGSIIGSDGFGYAHTKDGKHVKIYHNGHVEIGDDVEIGANATIDRAVFGKTIIKDGCKIDNLVHIGHNCEIGEHTIIVGQVGVSGSSKLGRNVVMGGQSGTSGHLSIADFTTIAARGGVTKSITESGGVYSGFPVVEHKVWLKTKAMIAKMVRK